MNESIKVEAFFHTDTSTWSYVVYSEETKSCIIIDPVIDFDPSCGKVWHSSADEIIKFVQDNNLNTEWVIDTHIHADHLTGMSYIKNVLGGKTGISAYVTKTLMMWSTILEDQAIQKNGSQFDHLFTDNELIQANGINLTTLHTPGHTLMDMTYIIEDFVFVGDLMFLPDVGTGRCDFPGGNASDAYKSIHRVLELPDDFVIHVGHDYPPIGRKHAFAATVKEQKMFNINIANYQDMCSYVAMRKKKDSMLSFPRLLLPSVQFNLRAGNFEKDQAGIKYLKMPINRL